MFYNSHDDALSDSDFYSPFAMSNYDTDDDFLPFDDSTELLAAGGVNDSTAIQSTASAEVIGVALYPVVTWFAVLLTLTSVGLVGNVIVVVAMTTLNGDSGRRRRSSTLVIVNLAVAMVALCVVVGPLEFAIVAENYVKRSVASLLCRAAAAVYHLFAGATVSCLVLYALVRRSRLWLAAVGRRSSSRSRRSAASDSGTCSASCRRQLANLHSSSASAGAVDVLPSCRYNTLHKRRH